MAIASKKIEKLLKDSRVVIKNIQALPEIKEKIDRYGFDEKRIKEGDDLLSKAEAMYNRQMTTRGEQIDMTGKLKEGIKEILKNYMVFRRMTRRQTRGIENEGLRKTLGIDGEARRTLTGVLKEAQQFYEGISTHEEIGKKLEKFSLTKEKLGSYLAELDELKRLNEAQEKKKGESQQSRKEGGWPVKVRWPMIRNSWRSWGFWPFRRATGARKRKSPVNRPQRRRRSSARGSGTACRAPTSSLQFEIVDPFLTLKGSIPTQNQADDLGYLPLALKWS